MKIGICDDISEYTDTIKVYVKHYFKMNNLSCEIHSYSNGIDLINSEQTFDILFLDIELPDTNGLDIAKKILSKDSNTIIVIVTNFRKYLDAAMDLNVLRFIDKPITQERINSVLSRAIEELNNGIITIHTKSNELKRIKKSDIVYVEVLRKTTTFYTTLGIFESNNTISKYKELLNSSYFAIPHNSYIVNLNFVLSYKRDKIEIDYKNTPIISVATRKQPEFRQKFINFIGEN